MYNCCACFFINKIPFTALLLFDKNARVSQTFLYNFKNVLLFFFCLSPSVFSWDTDDNLLCFTTLICLGKHQKIHWSMIIIVINYAPEKRRNISHTKKNSKQFGVLMYETAKHNVFKERSLRNDEQLNTES